MKNTLARALLCLAVVFFAQVQLKAQTTASITGVVSDPTGALLPGVNVTLQNVLTGVSYQAVTNLVGSYSILNVRPGPGYRISFSHDGFSPTTITDLYLNVDTTRSQNAQLKVGNAAQTVEVSASSEDVTLDTTDATVGNSVEVQYLNSLPVQNRSSPSALFYAQPGTTLDGSVTGARVDQSSVTVDGLDVNDEATGTFGAVAGTAPVDSVQEFRGVLAGQLSSAGEGGGGQYELVTRSGTNTFHGGVVEYHRDTNTAANGWFSNNTTPKTPRSKIIQNQYGGYVGGPITIPHVYHGRDKAFFFFDWNANRVAQGSAVTRTVPIGTYRAGNVSYQNNVGGITTLSQSDLATLDPSHAGFNSSIQSVFSTRYPAPNDLSGAAGDLVNTAGFRFNAPTPTTEDDYVARVDYNLTDNQKLFGRGTVERYQNILSTIEFPGDPQTKPRINHSRAWVVGHTWTIGNNKTNQASYGTTITDVDFPDLYNPTGANQYSLGGNGTGGVILSAPYLSAANAQGRTYPIPVIRDDFAWQKGKHAFTFGGTFKYINPHSYTILNYNSPLVGLSVVNPGLNASMRPTDILNSSTARARYDRAFATGVGHYGSVSSTYNYNAKGNVLPQGSGLTTDYRYYETELYFGDTWKLTPSLTVSYGVRWQNYSVPYEKNGIESLPTLNFDQYFSARVAQSKAGLSGDSAVPFISYVLGGKGNNKPGYFQPLYKNFAPRFAFAWSPSADRKSVVSGGGGIVYDHTVVNAVQYQASQFSYLFQLPSTQNYGVASNPVAAFTNDLRFGGFSSPPPPAPAPAAIASPYTPYVSAGVPGGLANGGAFNEGVTNNLKTPYSIMFNFGFEHQFPAGLILKTTYVGRLGRRLLGQADANQLIDFPDTASGQMMSTAFANIEQQMRATGTVTAQPWFEDVITPGLGASYGFNNNTELVAYGFDPYPARGDFADTVEILSSFYPDFPNNVGMGAQFSEDTYYTNKGFSNYHGLLVTLHKNAGHGVQFDFNYTWAHSIDNVSLVANAAAYGGYGFICDVLRPRNCRGNSDFDVTQYFNGSFIWELPFGRGREFAAAAPRWADEVIGGWDLSGLPTYHTGTPTFATSNAFVAGYANDAPAIFTGHAGDLASHPHKDATGRLWAFKNSTDSYANEFVGPVGFQIGSRNNLRGPHYFNLDLGLAKTFPIIENKLNLKFRCDAFNSLNHPSFSAPSSSGNLDITESAGIFGVITSTANSARVLQGALRLEF